MGDTVFLSHASRTELEARRLAEALAGLGLEVRLDEKDFEPGDRWGQSVQEALNEANAYVVLVRGGEEPGGWLRTEWKEAARRTALSPEKKIIPVVIGDGSIPPYLRLWQRIAMGDDVAETAQRIAEAIDAPGTNETPANSPAMRPVVERWRHRLARIEKSAEAMRPEAERVE